MKKWGFALDQSKVLEKLADKKIKTDDLAEEVIANLNLLPAIMPEVASGQCCRRFLHLEPRRVPPAQEGLD